MLCVVIKGPSLEEAFRQVEQALSYADLIELRLDLFDRLDFKFLQNILSSFSISFLFTLRSNKEGGQCSLPEDQRLELIEQLMALQPQFFDIEAFVDLSFIHHLTLRYPQVKLILSYHDFRKVLDDLDCLYEEMKRKPAYFYKMALMVENSVEMMKVLVWKRQLEQIDKNRLILILMGEEGTVSRILSPIIGNPITYASLDDTKQVALGQISAETLLNCFHFRSLNEGTAIYGLIGDPVHLSLSHITHNQFIRYCKRNAVYIKVRVAHERLKEFLDLAKQLPFLGLSVTMPLKEKIVPMIDEIDEEADSIHAVNTIVFSNGMTKGYNTDGIGALNAIEKRKKVKGGRVGVIGAGGAAKSIIYEAKKRGALVTVITRNKEQGVRTAQQFACLHVHLECMSECYDVLINTTPSELPIEETNIYPNKVVMDIKTIPKESLFLKHARQKDCDLIYGYEMFIEQAIEQFRLWFKDKSHILGEIEVLKQKVESLL